MRYREFKLQYSLEGEPDALKKLYQRAAKMSKDLDEWKDEIDKLRSQQYHLNYYTARQLSIMCQELSASCLQDQHSFQPWFCNLIEYVYPRAFEHQEVIRGIMMEISGAHDRRNTASLFRLESVTDEETREIVSPTCQPTSILSEEELDMDQLEIYDEFECVYGPELVLEALSYIQQESLQTNHQLTKEEHNTKVFDFCDNRDFLHVDSRPEELQIVNKDTPYNAEEMDTSIGGIVIENNPVIKQLLDADFTLEHAIEAFKRFGDDFEQAMEYCMNTTATWQDEMTLDLPG